jgi:hypothetical protein
MHVEWLRQAAKQIREKGLNGWGNTCSDAADHLEAVQAERDELAARCAVLAEALKTTTEALAQIYIEKTAADADQRVVRAREALTDLPARAAKLLAVVKAAKEWAEAGHSFGCAAQWTGDPTCTCGHDALATAVNAWEGKNGQGA